MNQYRKSHLIYTTPVSLTHFIKHLVCVFNITNPAIPQHQRSTNMNIHIIPNLHNSRNKRLRSSHKATLTQSINQHLVINQPQNKPIIHHSFINRKSR
ncbi:hypothetical protein HanRHA438_Chr08g0361081 [Helianthus annuus]|nr:hypothetical protein HanRHA438_Chr08g0361081 [Helianthus annuus]